MLLEEKFLSLFLVVFIVIFTYWRFAIIEASLQSLVFTSLYCILHFRLDPRFVKPDLIEYWVASVVWVGIAFGVCWKLFSKHKRAPLAEVLFRRIGPSWTPDGSILRRANFGIYVLLMFAGIALLGPFIVSLNPINQGDLETTRLLPPLRSAIGWQEMQNESSVLNNAGLLEGVLQKADAYLLERRVMYYRPEKKRSTIEYHDNTFKILFLCGTDALGRDVLSRVVYGTRISLSIGIVVAVLSMAIGVFVGFIAAMLGGAVDSLLMRIIDVLLAVPPLILILSFFSMLGGSVWVLILCLSLSGWMGVARIVRGEVLKLREREFVLSAKMLGVTYAGIIRNHLWPNVLPTILTAFVLQLVNSIMGEAALSFLGLGIQPPTPSWGNMIGESTLYINFAWWIGVFPGIALSLFAISAHILAEGIQQCQQ
ncbi:MAG TPA: ABC transporter permease [Bacteroidota bacterium]|nr:ABC transporter permease [Bacteroidota bacterium]